MEIELWVSLGGQNSQGFVQLTVKAPGPVSLAIAGFCGGEFLVWKQIKNTEHKVFFEIEELDCFGKSINPTIYLNHNLGLLQFKWSGQDRVNVWVNDSTFDYDQVSTYRKFFEISCELDCIASALASWQEDFRTPWFPDAFHVCRGLMFASHVLGLQCNCFNMRELRKAFPQVRKALYEAIKKWETPGNCTFILSPNRETMRIAGMASWLL